jgi:phospholipid/cholesterol/gamma-HCH transport system permease protein
LLDFLKPPVLAFQDFMVLSGRAFLNILRKPHYFDDIALQMESFGVGSMPIVILTGFFSGAILALQMANALNTYGATSTVGQIVSLALVREMGPVLTALLVAGRNASGMASEIGSMKVTEQIDAMRALGTDPIQKLVTPRLIAMAIMLPLLVIIADFIGMIGGYIVSCPVLGLTTATHYWQSSWRTLEYGDIAQGLLKPFAFAIVIALVGCYYGMKTTGGTQGVGIATTRAVVVACIWVFVLTFLIGKMFVSL